MIRRQFHVAAVLLGLAAAVAMVPARAASAQPATPDPAAALDEALQAGDQEAALEIARATADSARQHLGAHPADLATALDTLALRLLQAAGGGPETAAAGEALLRESLDLRQRALGEDHLDVATSLDLLSTAHYDQGLFDQSEDE